MLPEIEYPTHPIALAFPLIEGPPFDDLVASIKVEGQHHPCLLWRNGDGTVWLIDGRNRVRACKAAGVAPRYEFWEGGGSLVELIVSLNIRRRQLEVHQLAEIGLKLLPYYEQEARQRQEAGKPIGADAPKGKAVDQLGQKLGISGDSIKRAKRVRNKGSRELQQAVTDGVVSLATAADIAQLSARDQARRLNKARRLAAEKRTRDDKTALRERAGKHLDKLRRILEQLALGPRALKAAAVIAAELERVQP